MKTVNLSYHDPDHRYYPRFSPDKPIYVFHYDFGKVLDISMGGLLFQYNQDDIFDRPKEMPDTGVLLFCGDFLDRIPFTVVSDWPVSPTHMLGSFNVRKRRIAFGCLTEHQTEKIERLLMSHVSIAQVRKMEKSILSKPR